MKLIPLKKNFYMSMVILTVCLLSCDPPDPLSELSPEEKDVYITNRDKSVDFSNYATYFLLDSVHVVSKEPDVTTDTVQYTPLILTTIDTELQKLGFKKVTTPATADVGIAASVLKFSEEVPAGYFGFAGGAGYYGYAAPLSFGFPGYAYGIPGYYGYYQIDIGSISIEMYDLKSARTLSNNKLNIIWSAVLAGSLTETSEEGNNGDRIITAISAAFQQSPYLKEGK